jgi:hypothetical protein
VTERHQFDSVMKDLLIAHPERSRNLDAEEWERMCGVYFDVLHDIPIELLQTASRQCLATLKWFPKPAEIREQALQLVMISLGIPNANDAWAEVTRRMQNTFSVRRVGDRVQVTIAGMYEEAPGGYLTQRQPTAEDWSTPIIQKAIDGIGGWRTLRASENPIADRAQFLRAYERYSMRQMQAARMLPETREAILRWRENGGPLPVAAVAGQLQEGR